MIPTHAVFYKIADYELPEKRMTRRTVEREDRDRYPNIGSLGVQRSEDERMKQSPDGEYVPKNTELTYGKGRDAFSILADVNMSKVIRFGHGGIPESKFSILATNCPVQKHGIGATSPNSIDRFWNVVFSSERVDGIVVLGNADGNNIIDYWNPARVGDPTFYDKESYYTIESCIQEETSFYKKYKIIINSKGSNVKKTIDLWHYTDWPDGEGPTNPDNFERFVKMFVESRKLVVHCSAGVGRTGVFAGCVAAWKLGSGANPKEIVELMREARTHMVQKPGQFDILCKFTLRNCYGEAVSWSETLSEETVCRLCGIPRVVKES